MVAYVLLIVIGISLSVAVYAYLKLYLPSSKEKCPEDINLVIENAVCFRGQLNVTISNRGLFNVSMIFVRLGNESRSVRQQVNNKTELLPQPLAPSDTKLYSFQIPFNYRAGDHIVEVQPAVMSEKRSTLLCKNIATQPVFCY